MTPTYFLEQVGQVAQVAPLSAQHFMPQAGLEPHLDLPQQAQPVTSVAAHTSAAQRVRSFVIFIVGVFCLSSQLGLDPRMVGCGDALNLAIFLKMSISAKNLAACAAPAHPFGHASGATPTS